MLGMLMVTCDYYMCNFWGGRFKEERAPSTACRWSNSCPVNHRTEKKVLMMGDGGAIKSNIGPLGQCEIGL